MIWLLLILLILTLLFPSMRLFAEKYVAKIGVWVGLIDSILLILFGIIFLPAATKLQADFGIKTTVGLSVLYISIGLISSLGMFFLSLYSKRHHKTKKLFYVIYILGLTSMLLTVWSMSAVINGVSAISLTL